MENKSPLTYSPESPPSLPEKLSELPESSLPSESHTGRLIVSLICTVLAAVGVIVYGVSATKSLAGQSTPVGEFLLGEVFGTKFAALGHTYTMPPLVMIPPQTVMDGVHPGAAEDETLPPSPTPQAPAESSPVKVVDLSTPDDIFSLINETPYAPDTATLFFRESPVPKLSELHALYGEDAPVVLIIHTHGTESYLPEGKESVSADETFRTTSPDESVVAVGRRIKETLEGYGIGVIHTEKMFDIDDYNSAYSLAAEHIIEVCNEYPSISYVFDVHRDAMITTDGTHLKPTSKNPHGGVNPSQIMLVVGTDHAGSDHVKWEDNLTLALKLQAECSIADPTLMRSLNLRNASFNQQYTAGSLIVEVGSAAGTLTEALAAGEIFAEAASKVIIGG